MKKYDVVVIGSGVGGSSAAYALKEGGKSVALVEEDLWGGTCPNRGCDPKKVFVAGMEAVERNNQLAGKGLSPIRSINWPELLAFKRTFTDPFPEAFKKEAQGNGIDTIAGSACFVDERKIDVGGTVIEADAFIIATGQRPGILDIEGKEYLKTSTDFLGMEELPPRMAFLGAGYIAFELAAIANAAGSEVTVIHHNNRPLKGFDANMVSEMVTAFQGKGVRFVFDTEIGRVQEENGQFILSGDDYSAEADYVVCAAGRVPNIEKLELEKAGVAYGKRGISVNKYLQTSNTYVFACGDVIDKKQPKLTPVAKFEGQYIAKKILDEQAAGIVYPPVATVVYGSPKLAQVGIDVSEAQRQPEKYVIRELDMTGWFT
ncbi:MAG: NAD(P)/FAD-dependent oxidoreductase, partial [Christensenella sp.]|uniref:dihydrolipoyl dehydrogenase family protein n=1 Tax=Christensenella sp. TaxID=1935934 RepID=UPI002B201416